MARVHRISSSDIPRLNRIDMSYTAPFGYAYRIETNGANVRFSLEETRFSKPFERTYDWDWTELEDFALNVEKGLVWGAFDESGDPVGLLELRESAWNGSLWIQSLYVDQRARQKGVGTSLLDVSVEYAKASDARALFVETQVSNGPAIRFYLARGFHFCGLNDHFYTNDDASHGEVALFLVREIPV